MVNSTALYGLKFAGYLFAAVIGFALCGLAAEALNAGRAVEDAFVWAIQATSTSIIPGAILAAYFYSARNRKPSTGATVFAVFIAAVWLIALRGIL